MRAMTLASFFDSDNAVSESVGYLLVLSIMMLSMGAIYAIGYPALQSSIDNGHMQNMENGFIIIAKNLDRITTEDAPAQSTELKLNGGSLESSMVGRFNTTFKYVDGSCTDLQWEMLSLRYRYSYETVGYEYGAVLGKVDDGSYMIEKPRIVKGDPFIIPINVLWGSDTAVAGSGIVKVTAYGGSPSIYTYNNVTYVNMSVTSDFYLGWAQYFESSLGMITKVDPATHTTYAEYYAADSTKGIQVIVIKKPLTIYVT